MEIQERIEVLKKIQGALQLNKLSRKKETNRNFQRLLNEWDGKVRYTTRKFMDYLKEKLVEGLPEVNKFNIDTEIVDWDEVEEYGKRLFKEKLHEVLVAGGKAVVERKILKQDTFDAIGTESVKWAEDHSAELVTAVTEATKEGLRKIVTEMLPPGEPFQRYAKQIRPLVGLLDKHARSVGLYYSNLLEEGVPEERALRLMKKKAEKLHRYREYMIARTETANALSEGQRQGYKQMGVERLEWVASPGACSQCLPRDGDLYSIEDAGGQIPLHPNCRCSWVAAPYEF